MIDQDRKTNKRERRGERESISQNGQLLVSVSTLLRFAPICDERARVRTIVPAEFYEPRDDHFKYYIDSRGGNN